MPIRNVIRNTFRLWQAIKMFTDHGKTVSTFMNTQIIKIHSCLLVSKHDPVIILDCSANTVWSYRNKPLLNHHHDDDHHHCVQCDHHHHLCTMRSSSSMYNAIINIRVRCDHHNDPHRLCTMWWSSTVYDGMIINRVQCDDHQTCTMRW